MKRYLCLLILLSLIILPATACSRKPEPKLEQEDEEQIQNTGDEDIIDLTVMSATMIYAEVYKIMSTPQEYIGATIRMRGPYYASYYEPTDGYYHFVIIEDATACCSQGIEFIWRGNHTYPDDYPKNKTIIEMTGVFGSYDELDITYYYLAIDSFLII